MSESDNFLSRWSRRKRAVAEEDVANAKAPATESPAAGDADSAAPAGQLPAASAEPEFDVSSLPSLDSIGADTDVSLFLKPGVPPALRHAALRRVWVTDPAIRDFRAPQEMDWDFNKPGLAGFGEIGPDVDVKKMAARIFGDKSFDEPEAETHESSQPVSAPVEIAQATHAEPVTDSREPSPEPSAEVFMLQREEDVALQQDDLMTSPMPRRHGSALPQ